MAPAAGAPAHPRPERQPFDNTLLLEVPAHLTERDRYLLDLLLEHRILTTAQVADVAFTSLRRAEARLAQLYRLRLLDRFRPFTRTGSAPAHWILDTAGLHVLAASHGVAVESLLPSRRHALTLAGSSRLSHTTGVNGFFTRLLRASRTPSTDPLGSVPVRAGVAFGRADGPVGRLDAWWSERRCANTWSTYVRPDGYGVWSQGNTSVPFFLEFDSGTEPLTRLPAKIDGYTALAEATSTATVVLFVVGTPGRERNLHRALRGARVPVATCVHDPHGDPTSRIWSSLTEPEHPRRLIELPNGRHLSPEIPTDVQQPRTVGDPNARNLSHGERESGS